MHHNKDSLVDKEEIPFSWAVYNKKKGGGYGGWGRLVVGVWGLLFSPAQQPTHERGRMR